MPFDVPVCPPALQVSPAQAEQTLQALRQALPATGFTEASPAPICGLVAVKLSNGNYAYVDKSGRYFILGLLVDTATGATFDGKLELRDK